MSTVNFHLEAALSAVRAAADAGNTMAASAVDHLVETQKLLADERAKNKAETVALELTNNELRAEIGKLRLTDSEKRVKEGGLSLLGAAPASLGGTDFAVDGAGVDTDVRESPVDPAA